MQVSETQLVLAGLGFFLAWSIHLILGMRGLARVEAALVAQMTLDRQNFNERFADLKIDFEKRVALLRENFDLRIAGLAREHEGEIQVVRGNMGELGHALRTKIHEVEIWSRDEFVRGKEFDTVIAAIRDQMNGLGDRIESKLEKFERKIDDLVHKTRGDV